MTRNREVAALLYEIAQILEVQGVNFKPRAYERAAQNIEVLGEDVVKLAAAGRLTSVPGVGASIAEKVKEYLAKGRLAYLEDLRKEVPPGVLAMLQLPDVGPKTALRLAKELKIRTLADLERAAKAGKVHALRGFGEKTEHDLLARIQEARARPKRTMYPVALAAALAILEDLRRAGATRADVAGSLRRGRDTVGDLDLLAEAAGDHAAAVVEAFTKRAEVVRVVEKGTTRARVTLPGALGADLRVVPPESYGAALLYFTGSKEHGIALRSRALKRGWTINEYALSDRKTGKRLAGATEEEMYAKLGLDWIPPELREDKDEFALAARHGLPTLVALGDLRGDLHTHTDETDGRHPLAEMVAAGARRGYAWYGVSDHSKGIGILNGLDARRLAKQRAAIDALQERVPAMRILHGIEVDIKKDGSLGLDAAARASLDYVVASIHGSFDLDRDAQTRRLVRAMDEGADVLGHPTTRKIGTRPEIDADWDRVYDAAAERGVALEVNGGPDRLDLNGERVRRAHARGCAFAVDSDAHDVDSLGWIEHAVPQARRGGLEAADVLNTLTAAKVVRRLGRSKRR